MSALTELENILINDDEGDQLRQRIELLHAAAGHFSYQLRQPQEQQHYAYLERQRYACLAAMQIMETVWAHWHHHGGSMR